MLAVVKRCFSEKRRFGLETCLEERAGQKSSPQMFSEHSIKKRRNSLKTKVKITSEDCHRNLVTEKVKQLVPRKHKCRTTVQLSKQT